MSLVIVITVTLQRELNRIASILYSRKALSRFNQALLPEIAWSAKEVLHVFKLPVPSGFLSVARSDCFVAGRITPRRRRSRADFGQPAFHVVYSGWQPTRRRHYHYEHQPSAAKDAEHDQRPAQSSSG